MLSTGGNVYVKKSKIRGAGRGVFASRDIVKGEVIEICPIIEIPVHDTANLKESILVTYFFFYGKKKERALIALGKGSIYNHSYEPNAKYTINLKDKTIVFVALSDIKANKEITFNYKHGNPKNKDPLWFE